MFVYRRICLEVIDCMLESTDICHSFDGKFISYFVNMLGRGPPVSPKQTLSKCEIQGKVVHIVGVKT